MPQQRDHDVSNPASLPPVSGSIPRAELDTMPDSGAQFTTATPLPWLPSGSLVEGTFRIDRLLGAGSMGQVYLAHDETLDRSVALKLVGATSGNQEAWRVKFRNEARTMARVRHENVVALHSVGEYERWLYLVMEYVPGIDLQAWLRKQGPLPLGTAHGVITQVCRGLHAIHQEGAVHRDVKPGNILVSAGFRVALTDFGLARWVDTSHTSGERGVVRTPAYVEKCPSSRPRPRFPYEHGVVGTPAYVAPEMVLGAPPDPELLSRIDIYSLGVLAFELVTGSLPFEAPSPAGVLLAQLATRPPLASERAAGIPTSVDDAIFAAMAKDPRDRPSSAIEFLWKLERDLGVVSSR